MDRFLLGLAIVLFIFGALLLFSPGLVKKISGWLNKSVVLVEDMMLSSNAASGGLLVILSGIVFYLALR